MKPDKYALFYMLLKFYCKTLRFDIRLEEGSLPKDPRIYVFWHGSMLVLPFALCRYSDKVRVLVSKHADGQIGAEIIKNFGFKSVRGSAGVRKGGTGAFLKMMDELKNGNSVAIPVDGPRGPAGKVKNGVAKLSIESGVPVCPIIPVCSAGVNLKTWDSFFVPYPLSKCIVYVGKPVYPERGEDVGSFARRIENKMRNLRDYVSDIWRS